MKRKIIWLVVSCLMVLSLLLASCAPAAPEGEEGAAGSLARTRVMVLLK